MLKFLRGGFMLEYIDSFLKKTKILKLKDLANTIYENRVFLVCVDVLNGFCKEGKLASPLIFEIVEPIAKLTSLFLAEGFLAENLIFLNDSHLEDAVEFKVFPPHCIRGSKEAALVDELKQYMSISRIFLKNSLTAIFSKNKDGEFFFEFLKNQFLQGKCVFLVVGDCTDLCIYHNAMAIKLYANELNFDIDVVVSLKHVRTYDLKVQEALKSGVYAHEGEFFHKVFLYHMALNGIEIVLDIE